MILEQNDFTPTAVAIRKHGDWRTIGKVVVASPLDETVLAYPYKNRPALESVSAPLGVLKYAVDRGATAWVVRFDRERRCLRLSLQQIPHVHHLILEPEGWEVAVDLERFQSINWQYWAYVTDVVHLGGEGAHAV